eukprot:s1909_g4.t1
MDYCEWQPGSGEIPGGCAATKNPGVTCEACPFQGKCVEPDQSTVCADKTAGCDCAMARATKFGYGCLFVNGGCVARSTPNSAATSCEDCPTQIRCGTPRIEQVRPEEGHQLGELGIWSIEVDFDRPIQLSNQGSDDSGVQLLCDLFEENGGKTFWVSKWMVSAKNTTLEIYLKELANDYRSPRNIVFSAASGLPHGGLQTGQYLFYLPDTKEPTIRTFDPPNSVRGLGVDIQVKMTWSEPVARGRAMNARRVDLYRSGDELSNASFDFTAKEVAQIQGLVASVAVVIVVALTQSSLTVDLTGFLERWVEHMIHRKRLAYQGAQIEPNKFYSLALPPHCINDFSGNNFTGLPANVYIFGTAIDSVDADIDWQDTLSFASIHKAALTDIGWITLGVVIVVLLFFIGGAVAYLVLQSGQKNARIFSRAVRKTSKKPSQVAPIYVEDVDDGFYHQPSPVTNSQAGNVPGATGDTPIESFRAASKVGVAWEGGGSKTPKLLSPTGADAVLRSSSKVSLAGITAHSKTSENPGQNLEVLARGFSKMSLQSTARVTAPVARSPSPPTKPDAELADLPRGHSKVSLAWEGPKSLGSAVLRQDLESLPRSGSKLKLPDVSAKRSSSRSISPGGPEILRGGSKMSVQSASGHELHVARTFSKLSVHSAGRTELPLAREARSPRPSPRGAGGRHPHAGKDPGTRQVVSQPVLGGTFSGTITAYNKKFGWGFILPDNVEELPEEAQIKIAEASEQAVSNGKSAQSLLYFRKPDITEGCEADREKACTFSLYVDDKGAGALELSRWALGLLLASAQAQRKGEDACSLASRQLAADVVTYSSVMSACAPGGNWQVVLDMLAAMRMATLELDSIAHDASQRAFEAAEIQLRHRRLRLTSRPLVAAKSSLLQGIRLHFCIFQAEEQGLSGWTLEQGSLQNRWDVILDGLLKAVMMDGQWPRDVAAHAFVGADAVHITGAIQEQVMPIVGYKAGRAQYQPATPKAFEETLWRSCEEEGLQGIRWELGGAKESLEDAKEAQLANLDALLSEIKAAGTAIAFATKDARGSYGDLLRSSQASRGLVETLFLLLGGAHGFDGLDDVDGSHQEAILNRFRDHLGDSGVACLVLGSSLEDPPKLSLANVVSFLRVEDLQGHLRLVANMAKGR